MENKLRDADQVQLTLHQARETPYEEHEFKLGELFKKHKITPEDLPLQLVFCKDKSGNLPENFPIRNSDIIQEVRNQA